MSPRLWFLIPAFLALLLLPRAVIAQTSTIPGFAGIPDLDHLTRSSGYVFCGTVLSVAKTAGLLPAAAETVRVTLRVEQGVRGARTGQVFTMNEWVGLWNAGEHYGPGERVLLFLYPVSRLGLTSPVGGSQGRFSLDQSGHIVLPPRGTVATSAITARPLNKNAVIPRSSAIRQLEKE